MENLKTQLCALKLAAICQDLELRNRYALQHKIGYIEFLELLVEDEMANRQTNGYINKLRESKLDTQKILDCYDFSYQPQVDKRQIYDLASCRFIEQKYNVLFMGKPGVGKTHLAHAIGLEAVKKGKRVLSSTPMKWSKSYIPPARTDSMLQPSRSSLNRTC